MVEDDAGLVALPGSIRTVIDILLLSAAYAEETDDVVVARLNGVISEGDARRWGSLSEDGDVVTYLELRLQAMTPATSKTMILFPVLTASLKEPVPLSLRLVTCTTFPPLPPVTYLP